MENLFSKKLKELREEAELTQEGLAEKLAIKRYYVSNWEQGRTEPDLDMLIKLSKFFKVNVGDLLGAEEYS